MSPKWLVSHAEPETKLELPDGQRWGAMGNSIDISLIASVCYTLTKKNKTEVNQASHGMRLNPEQLQSLMDQSNQPLF